MSHHPLARFAMAAAGAMLAQSCSPPTVSHNEVPTNAAAGVVMEAPKAVPRQAEGKPFAVEEKTELLEFAYRYPKEAAAVPEIVARFADDMKRLKDAAGQTAREDRESARQNGFPFHAHSSQTTWTTKAATPLLLSLLAESYFYTGGAHGMTGYKTLVWDRTNGRETSIATMAVSEQALATAIGTRFCAALNKARAEKRGAPVTDTGGEFDRCVDPMKQALVPVSTDGKAVDQLLVVIGPYEAGPYSEGSYEIALPVDVAMLTAIKPEYREAFKGT
ncbi:MAG: DUF4163 domain-containing protein [Sphingobium sp.]|uniref:DUF4163 domain-containing protein n=1 Tax=Sphingobium sp. TaxID=1912891 RepID=UPI0029A8AF16|nr:DUF4163 domain-containing protein [Sphingobium sp.]MDX3910374.1 DUF4163 domain-containing protein [Sphingobium sp.]